jgi:hypothetical protein
MEYKNEKALRIGRKRYWGTCNIMNILVYVLPFSRNNSNLREHLKRKGISRLELWKSFKEPKKNARTN